MEARDGDNVVVDKEAIVMHPCRCFLLEWVSFGVAQRCTDAFKRKELKMTSTEQR
jgi:hypothetical protein